MSWKETSMKIINVENVDMKVNKIRFSKLKQQYDMLLFTAGLSQHEKNMQCIKDMFIDEDGIAHEFGVPGLIKSIAVEEIKENVTKNESVEQTDIRGLKYQIKALEELRGELLDEEKYEEVIEAEEILVKLKRELNRLKNGI